MDNIKFELLLAKDSITHWEIIGITYSHSMAIQPTCKTLRATLFAIEKCKKALHDGKKIIVSKVIEHAEIQPNDIVIEDLDELSALKQISINEISSKLHQALFAISVIDLMDYLNCYINLLNAGYFITDKNREDKYFEIIEASQTVEEPKELKEDSTFEEEQQYIEQKQKYDNAQFDLSTLEKYLNAYDKLTHIKRITDFLTESRLKIEKSTTIDEINTNMKIFNSLLDNYKLVK